MGSMKEQRTQTKAQTVPSLEEAPPGGSLLFLEAVEVNVKAGQLPGKFSITPHSRVRMTTSGLSIEAAG